MPVSSKFVRSGLRRATPRTVTLFIQCLIDAFYPEVAEAVVAVLKNAGLRVSYPGDQTCCGQPAFNSGHFTQAQKAARHFIEVFENAEIIVCPSGSCVDMVRNHYTALFAREPAWLDRSLRVAEKTFEFSQFLVDVLGIDDLGACYAGRLTYHDSCHLLRGLGVAHQPRRLIAAIKGADFTEMVDADRCCGFGGTFAFKYPTISSAMLADKVTHIQATGADAVVGCDMGCLMNIQGMLSKRRASIKTYHIAQLLANTL